MPSWFPFELTHPLFLLGLLALPLLIWYFYRSLVDFAPGSVPSRCSSER